MRVGLSVSENRIGLRGNKFGHISVQLELFVIKNVQNRLITKFLTINVEYYPLNTKRTPLRKLKVRKQEWAVKDSFNMYANVGLMVGIKYSTKLNIISNYSIRI